MVTLLFALFAGILTVAAPCTLPVLPVLFGASIGQTNKARPVFIALGFVASFSIVAIVFSAITQIVGIDPTSYGCYRASIHLRLPDALAEAIRMAVGTR